MQSTEEHKVVVFIKPRSWVPLNGFCDRIEGLVERDNRSLSMIQVVCRCFDCIHGMTDHIVSTGFVAEDGWGAAP